MKLIDITISADIPQQIWQEKIDDKMLASTLTRIEQDEELRRGVEFVRARLEILIPYDFQAIVLDTF